MLPTLLLVTVPANAADAGDVFEPIKDRDPYAYVIGVILLLGMAGLMTFLRILWSQNGKLQKEKDELHESKLKFALDAGTTMKEAVQIVQAVHDKMEPMLQGEQERKQFQTLITEKIDNMEKNLTEKLKDMHVSINTKSE